jgi:hypothetical protein
VLQEEQRVKKFNLKRLEDEMKVKLALFENLERINDAGRASYVEGRTNHDDMISALSQAKIYIA